MEEMVATIDPNFWLNKRVLITGHTGFKGGWLSLWLNFLGAKVGGISLAPPTNLNLFHILELERIIEFSVIGDIRVQADLEAAISSFQPDIIFHMAAQSLVRQSYLSPVETYATNVMGTVHLLESLRKLDKFCAAVMVTSDKCYENNGSIRGFREDDPMGGYDPYSNSKGCAELVTAAFRKSFFSDSIRNNNIAIASARAGNVIGGGDWAKDRLIPDAFRAFEASQSLVIRNPHAIRPWQHVFEPLSGYLALAQSLYKMPRSFDTAWNFGPPTKDCCSVQNVVDSLIKLWGPDATWLLESTSQPHEANELRLDCTKATTLLNWTPRWDLNKALQNTVNWHQTFLAKKDMLDYSLLQINDYLKS